MSLPPPSASSQVVPTRSFINLSAPLISRRMEYLESRSIGYVHTTSLLIQIYSHFTISLVTQVHFPTSYSPEQMYNVVANVDQYQQFVPWCKKSKVTRGRNGDMRAQLEIGFPPIVERYTSEVTVIPNHQVRVSLFRNYKAVPIVNGRHYSCFNKNRLSGPHLTRVNLMFVKPSTCPCIIGSAYIVAR